MSWQGEVIVLIAAERCICHFEARRLGRSNLLREGIASLRPAKTLPDSARNDAVAS